MNNRYTFRGRRYDNGEWIEGWITSQFKKTHDGELLTRIKSTVFGGGEHLVNTETVGQCTGLKDKNEKLIFEGDIVKDVQSGICYLIKWFPESTCYSLANKNGEMNFGCDELEMFLDDLAVIGNIHDNPELLEAKS